MKYEKYGALNVRFIRLLAKQELKKELYHKRLREDLSYVRKGNKEKNYSDDISAYTNLKKRGLNNLDLYKKVYNHRYAKKNVFGKLDCYCEKKLFDKIDYINELAEKKWNNKKSFIKKIFQKYFIPLFFFSLLPLLGSIFIILFDGKDKAIIKVCNKSHTGTADGKCDNADAWFHVNDTFRAFEEINYILFYYIVPIIVILVIIYILLKLIKYERLKTGKDKMSVKQYCRLCKSIL
ncbi:variable surface protein Vir35, putative [Plasmodium vivax]|uniref:Variable surface protein Vir35, putative n=1 Tax=Plasmodium vivax (strain Salvador I) TaxID=126793 RepID=A5KD73_PLAVS|nr:variable surface protein Vir35, putative [Plasmodium vivax]EDL42696.1 variable surface protein Vir35, putative [Plasmodium vivax]|eukprot:XP_001612489.1 variable surface protein Vir35 [Plasmodium vivax Sal-1]